MVTTPRINPNRIPERGLPDAPQVTRAPIEAFGGGQQEVTAEAQRLLGLTSRIAQEERQKVQRKSLLEFDNRLLEEETRIIGEAKKSRGKNAEGVTQNLSAQFEKFHENLQAEVADERVKEALTRAFNSRSNSFKRFGANHELREREIFDQQQHESFLQNLLNSTIENADTPDKIQENIELGIAAIEDRAGDLGQSKQAIKAQTSAFESQSHLEVIRRLLGQGRNLDARAYFDVNKGKLVGDQLAAAERVVLEGSSREEAQTQADLIMANDDLDDRGKLEAARDIKDADIRDRVVNRVQNRTQEIRALDRIEANEDYEEAFTIVQNTQKGAGFIGPVRTPQMVLDSIPADLLDKLSLKQRNNLKKAIFAPAKTNGVVWLRFLDSFQRNPSAIRNMNLNEFHALWVHMAPGDRKKAEGMKFGDPSQVTQVQSKLQMVKGVLRTNGIIPFAGELDENQQFKLQVFLDQFDIRLAAFEQEKGKEGKATPDDMRGIANDMMKETVLTRDAVTIPWWVAGLGFAAGGGFATGAVLDFFGVPQIEFDHLDEDDKRKLFNLTKEERQRAFIDIRIPVPPLALSDIKTDLADAKSGFTEEKARRMYNALYIAGDRELYGEILREEDE